MKTHGFAFLWAHSDKQDEGITCLHTGMVMQSSRIRDIVQ